MEMKELLRLAPVDKVPHSADSDHQPTAHSDKKIVKSRAWSVLLETRTAVRCSRQDELQKPNPSNGP